jgi:hypothetical protein
MTTGDGDGPGAERREAPPASGLPCLSSVRQETPDFFPGWRLMNLGLDAFVPATIQNSS